MVWCKNVYYTICKIWHIFYTSICNGESEWHITAYPSWYGVISPTVIIAQYQPGLMPHISLAHISRWINCCIINRLKHDLSILVCLLLITPGPFSPSGFSLGRHGMSLNDDQTNMEKAMLYSYGVDLRSLNLKDKIMDMVYVQYWTKKV